ncbi:hypothetical protein [Clostridium pasteurianum]|uniref:Uncharacterized protein n=1 Tax=Clostridium pasteurianum BC1 TaxID=86416 RepID=R4KAN8_CLOPA|nr:hypothetical protein [Clostridium pasteurianum]AGK96705.1 hypothetical protein Clopa_1797 [Clostridium pasteurianum BC1]
MSDKLRTNVKGYHVNDNERCLKFISEEKYLITSKDKFWLGFGMYFWDNNSNAEYWKKQKIKKEPNVTYIKVSSNIFIDEEYLLDLTDVNIVNGLEYLWKLYCKKKKEEENQPLGIKIDKLIEFFEDMKSIKVIKGIGNYDINHNKTNTFINKESYSGPQIDCNLKAIYCARNYGFVVNRKVES